jgi:hypothetical protein
MTKIPTLYDKLKPSVKAKLKQEEAKYSASIRPVIAKLESNHFIGDLTIDDMKTVHLFSETSYVNQTGLEFMWGEKIFDNYEGND